MVEIMVALRSIGIVQHWLDPGKGITRLAGAWRFAKELNSVKTETPVEANRRKGHIAGEFCQSRNTL
jgi:hypothetical protein